MVGDQIHSAQSLGIDSIVLGLNHTRNTVARFQKALEALDTTSKLFLYNLPTFKPTDQDFILECLQDPRVVGMKDSSGDANFFSWLLTLKKDRPNFQVFHGSESAYGQLSDKEFSQVDGLVSGNANVHPALLHAYMHSPRHTVHAHCQSELHRTTRELS
jgi:4-hydroxy-tetrahydrodipicolinate synthase